MQTTYFKYKCMMENKENLLDLYEIPKQHYNIQT
jgi:hypothetical protein